MSLDIFPKSINITIYYDKTLQIITKTPKDPAFVSEGITFVQQLYFIFSSYPEIEQIYPPGTLAMTLNGKRPTEFDELKEGDEIHLSIPSIITWS